MRPKMRYVILQADDRLEFVEMPATHAYQLSALNRRLHKEIGKLTADNVPNLPVVVAEADNVDVIEPERGVIIDGLKYINNLEHGFSSLNETSYPLISLLTEIRALQAQLEQWYEEETEQAD